MKCHTVKDEHDAYDSSFCFSHSTYFNTINGSMPEADGLRETVAVHYYQWVPLILTVQALACFLPSCLWNAIKSRSGEWPIPSSFNITSSKNRIRLKDDYDCFECS